MNKYNHYIEGKIVATYSDKPKYRTLEQCIAAAKRSRRDARLVQILAAR